MASRLGTARRVLACWRAYALRYPQYAPGEFLLWLGTVLQRRYLRPLPWLTFPAIRWLAGYLRPGMQVFEWGSGGSTLFFARRAAQVVTVEHDEQWARLLARSLGRQEAMHVELHLVAPGERPEGAGSAEEELFASRWPEYGGLWFEDYVKAICRYPEGSFDLILVDGRARVGCLYYAWDRVRPGGAVILDNSDRPEYAAAFRFFPESAWHRLDFTGPGPWAIWPLCWQTTVFLRRAGEAAQL